MQQKSSLCFRAHASTATGCSDPTTATAAAPLMGIFPAAAATWFPIRSSRLRLRRRDHPHPRPFRPFRVIIMLLTPPRQSSISWARKFETMPSGCPDSHPWFSQPAPPLTAAQPLLPRLFLLLLLLLSAPARRFSSSSSLLTMPASTIRSISRPIIRFSRTPRIFRRNQPLPPPPPPPLRRHRTKKSSCAAIAFTSCTWISTADDRLLKKWTE